HYEVSNFARQPALAPRHNHKYWRHAPDLGLGPSAHSFRNGRRWWNHRELHRYLSDLAGGLLPVAAGEVLGPAELRLETLFLGLRTAAGIDLQEFQDRFGEDLATTRRHLISVFIQEGLLVRTDRQLLPTPRGMAVADGLSRCL
ncbi:MAG: coproporphyrinogen III oxidase family protein, partial [Syntrophobacterales bacterium]|nr:coproporphyrinogen III oxidase family protein [Syntrophobacterales bacterium]